MYLHYNVMYSIDQLYFSYEISVTFYFTNYCLCIVMINNVQVILKYHFVIDVSTYVCSFLNTQVLLLADVSHTVTEAIADPVVTEYINQGLKRANDHSVSKAARVQASDSPWRA